jgi:bacillithiol system protein YtxJ
MNWIHLTREEQLEEIKNSSDYHIIFKHSTRCSISMMARKGFELDWQILPENTPVYFLDLIKYRELSNKIAEIFQVYHESPQVLVIKNGECVLDQSHGAISAAEIAEIMAA